MSKKFDGLEEIRNLLEDVSEYYIYKVEVDSQDNDNISICSIGEFNRWCDSRHITFIYKQWSKEDLEASI